MEIFDVIQEGPKKKTFPVGKRFLAKLESVEAKNRKKFVDGKKTEEDETIVSFKFFIGSENAREWLDMLPYNSATSELVTMANAMSDGALSDDIREDKKRFGKFLQKLVGREYWIIFREKKMGSGTKIGTAMPGPNTPPLDVSDLEMPNL